jgi:exodeoxyribonuclease VII large subunit
MKLINIEKPDTSGWISVSELTYSIKLLLENNIGFVTVQGEVSNYKSHSSGHRYFTLKDEGASISCTLWRGVPVNFEPSDGMKVIIEGNLTVYPPRGQYQIECLSIRKSGIGDLYILFEKLKQKLDSLGYFDVSRKKPIPQFSFKIGISTSATGAAIQDMKTTIDRRFPLAAIYFRQTLVQGDGAAADIANAIKELNDEKVDVIIIGRGGGSIEDLWAFNEEIVATTIYNSHVPIISAVGHETDFTIADFVADVRAATPTAAAELITSNTNNDLIKFTENSFELLERAITREIDYLNEKLESNSSQYMLRRINEKLKISYQQVDDLDSSMQTSMNHYINNLKLLISSKISHLSSLNPASPLRKGFALIKVKGKIIKNNITLKNIQEIEIIREKEIAIASVKGVKKGVFLNSMNDNLFEQIPDEDFFNEHQAD